MPQIITIGSAVVDIFIHTSHFQVKKTEQGVMLCQSHGSKLEVDQFKVFTGGGGSNTAVAFTRLGFDTAVISETGRDSFAHVVTQDLKENGVATNLMINEKKEQTGGSVILVCSEGERSILVHRGAAAMLDPFDIPAYWLSQAEQIHLCNIGGQLPTLHKIFQYVDRSNITSLSWNPGKQELALLADRQLDISQIPCQIFIVNQEEWQLASSVQNEILKYIPFVVVTAGRKGGDVYVNNQDSFHFPAASSKVVDTTGAGDAFSAGFVAAIFNNKTALEAAGIGAQNAASVVSYYGAKTGLLTQQDVNL